MEAKRIRPVYARIGASAVRVLLEFRYGGHTELILEPPLLIHNTDGSYTQEIMEIYGKKTNELGGSGYIVPCAYSYRKFI